MMEDDMCEAPGEKTLRTALYVEVLATMGRLWRHILEEELQLMLQKSSVRLWTGSAVHWQRAVLGCSEHNESPRSIKDADFWSVKRLLASQ